MRQIDLRMTPEEKARQQIDAILSRCGWTVQDKSQMNLHAAKGVALRELSFKTGEPDYTLFVDGKAIATVEAKPEGHSLTGVEEQSTKYVTGLPSSLPVWRSPLPFSYESTGTETARSLIESTRTTGRLSLTLWVFFLKPLLDSSSLSKVNMTFHF
jgi:type I site-specific restriction endonuclease